MTGRAELHRRAVEALARAVDKPPPEVKDDLTIAVRAVAAFRDELIAEWRNGGGPEERRRLDQANAILSLVTGQENPLGGLKRKHMEQARDALEAMPPE